MRTIAIDPGFGRCGVAIVEKENGTPRLLASLCIETTAKLPFPERLGIVLEECEKLIDTYKPTALALEKLYFSNNQKTAMQVAEVRGGLIGLGARYGLALSEYTPGEIKSAVTGNGRADKTQIAKMIPLLIKLNKPIRLDDEYDAIAVGLTHLARVR
ncbi:MAG: crossover junction endodeoxyribonuclease RuvC, crossover junction endodeoxyribonuclease RuvC [Candidatus Parcubacteria bacterium]|jgi:crossover junction endodeoxyribonuclease RuvC